MERGRVNKRYDRPISRRIVESAGVPREAFGFLKSGIFTVAMRPKHPELRVKFFEHVGKNIGDRRSAAARCGSAPLRGCGSSALRSSRTCQWVVREALGQE
jgi:hypothetical protein